VQESMADIDDQLRWQGGHNRRRPRRIEPGADVGEEFGFELFGQLGVPVTLLSPAPMPIRLYYEPEPELGRGHGRRSSVRWIKARPARRSCVRVFASLVQCDEMRLLLRAELGSRRCSRSASAAGPARVTSRLNGGSGLRSVWANTVGEFERLGGA
jgi:hypothetical protein